MIRDTIIATIHQILNERKKNHSFKIDEYWREKNLQTFPANGDGVREYIECHLLNCFHKIFSTHGQSDFKTNEIIVRN